jgi:hypothetical protein
MNKQGSGFINYCIINLYMLQAIVMIIQMLTNFAVGVTAS